MTLSEIVGQIRLHMPLYTSALSPILSVNFVSSTTDTATVTTNAPHGLQTGAPIVVTDYKVGTTLDSWTQDGEIYTFTTGEDHDLTPGWHDTVEFRGFNNNEWNGTFPLVSVLDSRNFKISSPFFYPPPSGETIVLENRIGGVNGYYAITVLNHLEFSFEGDFISRPYPFGHREGVISTAVRVVAAVDIDRVIEQYTRQSADDLWMIVLPEDVDVGRSIYAESDAIATITASDDFRLRLLDGFTLAIIKSTVNESAAVEAVDLCRHDLLPPILKTLCGARFSSGLTTGGDFRSSLSGHGVMRYTDAYMVYRYDFEVVMDTVIEDTVYEGDTAAFRDVYYEQAVRVWQS